MHGISDELISAYLDDELTADERQAIERAMQENAGLRRMADELRSIQTALRSLPTYKMEDDFGDQVLRLAERAIFTDAAADAELQSGSTLRCRSAPRVGEMAFGARRGNRAGRVGGAACRAALGSAATGRLGHARSRVRRQVSGFPGGKDRRVAARRRCEEHRAASVVASVRRPASDRRPLHSSFQRQTGQRQSAQRQSGQRQTRRGQTC